MIFSLILLSIVLVSASGEPISTNVKQGWNLVAAMIPNTITGGDITLGNIKSVYQIMPISKEYIRIWNGTSLLDSNNPAEDDPNFAKLQFTEFEISVSGYDDERLLQHFAMWVYSDKEGTLEYESIAPADYPAPSQLIAGWNFVALLPSMFNESGFVTLNTLKGNCDFLQAYFIDKDENADDTWISINLDEVLSDSSFEGRGFIVEVPESCILGKGVEGTTCVDSDGGLNWFTDGTLNLTNSTGTYLKTDSCVEGGSAVEYECYIKHGEVKINENIRSCSTCDSNSCIDRLLDVDSTECIDSDKGIYNITHDGFIVLKDGWSTLGDVCLLDGVEVDDCEGTGCSVKEYSCNGDLEDSQIVSCSSFGGECHSGACSGAICRLEDVNEITCDYKGVSYFIKVDSCVGITVNLNVTYEGTSELLNLPTPSYDLLGNGIGIKNRGSLCSQNIVNLEILDNLE